jgi:hypothetical protein
MADWKALEIKIPGKDQLEGVRSTLEALVVFLEIIKALLNTISLFLIDFGNPIRPIVMALLAVIQQLFESLKRTGLYGYFDIPDPTRDPNFDLYKGGYQAFTERFKASLFDSKDPYRPQPLAGSMQSGFVLIVADATTVFGLLRLMKILLRFFGKEITAAKYVAPANARIFPAGTKPGATGGTNIDPILQVASVFGFDLKGFALEWTLATQQYPPDPGFNDLVASVSSELIPQKWLIEKTSRSGGPVPMTATSETNFEDKRGKAISREVIVRDEQGDVFRQFQDYIVIDPTSSTSVFSLFQLGKFRYLDSEVEKDTTYYYRIRAFSGPLVVSDGSIDFPAPEVDATSGELIQRWPSSDPNDPVVMGRPSPILTCRLPNIPANFDVISILEATFKMAFAIGFQLPLAADSQFDDTGLPINGTSSSEVGKGSLTNIGGALSRVLPMSYPVPVTADPTTKEYPDVPQNYLSVKLVSSQLAQQVGSSLLENSAMLQPLRDLYQGGIPRQIPTEGNFRENNTSIQAMVLAFNDIPSTFPQTYEVDVYTTYTAAYSDVNTRLNLLDAVNFIKSFTLGGTPVDWVSISLLRDIIPWSGQFIYDLLNRIDALADAFKSAVDEIKAYIDAVTRKIDVLERFIKYLIELLNYLDSFSAGFYFLNVPSTSEGIPGWIKAIDNAGGTKPSSGPGGYSAGVALAYAGTDVSSFATAFGLIF